MKAEKVKKSKLRKGTGEDTVKTWNLRREVGEEEVIKHMH